MVLHHIYASPALAPSQLDALSARLRRSLPPRLKLASVSVEYCYNWAPTSSNGLSETQVAKLQWLLNEPGTTERLGTTSVFDCDSSSSSSSSSSTVLIIEVAPRLSVCTAWSTNASAILASVGLDAGIARMERSRRYRLELLVDASTGASLTTGLISAEERDSVLALLHDRMTEFVTPTPLASFDHAARPEPCFEVDVLSSGAAALRDVSDRLGLAFDAQDVAYYTELFGTKLGRNPTSVEVYDMAQSNSEHSRHWFFCGRLVLDGEEQPLSLMKLVKRTQTETAPTNSVIAFHDNSSVIEGFQVRRVAACQPAAPGALALAPIQTLHSLLTAETHNFPTGVAPFQGATTGTGGRIRDVQATGRGAHVVAGTAGYCVGNLRIPGHELPWETTEAERGSANYPDNMATPLQIAVEASNGASDYGNKFGEPVVAGFTRSFGLTLPGSLGERREWVKPIMFSAGLGTLDARHATKESPRKGMLVVKVGGPAYRVGMGGGAASSVDVQGGESRDSDLDFSAVQRGDAEMEQKMNRVIRACVELGDDNPILSIHDQGAGGNGNVLKEIVEGEGDEKGGAEYAVSRFCVGDPTLSAMELWGAEYQENCALLCQPEKRAQLEAICARERVPVSFVGEVTGTGRVVLKDDTVVSADAPRAQTIPVDLELDLVLGKMPAKVFTSDRNPAPAQALILPEGTTLDTCLERVLKLLSVGSKRFLTNKVDRSVTGLIAQQQCVGPLHTPLANCCVLALSHHGTVGTASAIGEQPIKGLVSNTAGGRMAVAEAMTNLVWAPVTRRQDLKFSGNWMWAAKLPGEGAALHDTCVAMCDLAIALGVAADGGKDSLSMATRVGDGVVKAPGELVISMYAGCPDITKVVTPDLKLHSGDDQGQLFLVDLSGGKTRLGGSALAQVFGQIGTESPNVDDAGALAHAFDATQALIKAGALASGHDRSDGGLIVTLLEMAFAGNCGLNLTLDELLKIDDTTTTTASSAAARNIGGGGGEIDPLLAALFNEELGLVIEVTPARVEEVRAAYAAANFSLLALGTTGPAGPAARISITHGDQSVVDVSMPVLRDTWESTSFALEALQCNPTCVAQERDGMRARLAAPAWSLSFAPGAPVLDCEPTALAPLVAIVREEGSNGDREMAAALNMAGFNVWDVTMGDICNGRVDLDKLRGLVFVGGFSYADVLGSAKGWAGAALLHEDARAQLDKFRARDDVFSLGVCNGCQLMALMGWVGQQKDTTTTEAAAAAPPSAKRSKGADEAVERDTGVVFTHNASGRFESRFSTVRIEESPAVLLDGMAGSVLGIWVAHGEGRADFSKPELQEHALTNNLAPIRYADDSGAVTEAYPHNPNGSPAGIAALCSPCGRHLAMMPHPERCVLKWQWPWMPRDWNEDLQGSPWMRVFENAYKWCLSS